MVFLILAIVMFNCSDIFDEEEKILLGWELGEKEQRAIVEELVPLVKEYDATADSNNHPTIQGGIIFWRLYIQSGYIECYDFWAPKKMKAKSSDEKLTVFLITDVRFEKVGIWSDEEGKEYTGYKQYTEIVVIYWPEKEIVGNYIIEGKEPEEKMEYYIQPILSPVNGESGLVGDEQVEDWIASLPRGN